MKENLLKPTYCLNKNVNDDLIDHYDKCKLRYMNNEVSGGNIEDTRKIILMQFVMIANIIMVGLTE